MSGRKFATSYKNLVATLKMLVAKLSEAIVPIENEESRPKNNLQSYNNRFIQSEIKIVQTYSIH